MIQIPAQATVFVMHAPVNFRNGIDGLAGLARGVLAKEPMICVGNEYVAADGQADASECSVVDSG